MESIYLGADLKKVKLKGICLSGARLLDDYILPLKCDDTILIDCYKSCKDPQAKWLLDQILVGKELFPKFKLKVEIDKA